MPRTPDTNITKKREKRSRNWERKNPEKDRKTKKQWYQRNQIRVRSQQHLHNWCCMEIEKRLSAKQLGKIGTAEGITVLNEYQMRCPTFRVGHQIERWKGGELMTPNNRKPGETPKEMADRHESERAGLRQHQDEDKSAQIIEHRKQTRQLEDRQAFERNGGYSQSDSQIVNSNTEKPAVDPSTL